MICMLMRKKMNTWKIQRKRQWRHRQRLEWCFCKPRTLKIAGRHQSLERGILWILTVFRGNQPSSHNYFRFLASKTMQACIFVVLSHPICDSLLWQPQKMNIYPFTILSTKVHMVWLDVSLGSCFFPPLLQSFLFFWIFRVHCDGMTLNFIYRMY